mgnify:CR=1 FL=1
MSDSRRGLVSSKPISCEDFLLSNINSYMKKSRHMENGGALHSMILSIVEKQLLKMTLEETSGNQSQAAHILGLNRNTLRRKLGDYKIKAKYTRS